MEPGEDGPVARRAADFDGVVLFPAVLGAEDVDAASLGRFEGDAARDDLVQRARRVEERGEGAGVEQRQIVRVGEGGGVGQVDHERGGEKVGGLRQPDREAVKRRVTVAGGAEGALHGRGEVVRGVRHVLDPGKAGVDRQEEAGEVAVVGAGLQRLRPAGGDREDRIARRAEKREAVCRQRLCRGDDGPVVARGQHDGNPDAEIGPGAGQTFDEGGTEWHGYPRAAARPI